jgi:hypothetical protein
MLSRTGSAHIVLQAFGGIPTWCLARVLWPLLGALNMVQTLCPLSDCTGAYGAFSNQALAPLPPR